VAALSSSGGVEPKSPRGAGEAAEEGTLGRALKIQHQFGAELTKLYEERTDPAPAVRRTSEQAMNLEDLSGKDDDSVQPGLTGKEWRCPGLNEPAETRVGTCLAESGQAGESADHVSNRPESNDE